jgi:UDP-N-acetylglucosamine 3-dehydrogenase
VASFLNYIINDEEVEITGEDGLNALKMVLAANKSSKEQVPISLDEIND